MPHLVIEVGSAKPQIISLDANPRILGRDGICEIVLDDLKASRRHARIFRDEHGSYIVEDLGSKNGTLVNGRPLQRHRLVAGDRIEIGTTVLVFQDAAGESIDSTYVLEDQHTRTESTSVVGRQERFQLSQKRLEMLSDLTERLVRLQNKTGLLNDVMSICFETLRFERGLILCKNLPGEAPVKPVVRNLREDATGQFSISRTILNRALQDGERTIINDSAAELVDPTVSMATHHIRSAMCVPLEYRGEVLGVIYGDRVTSTTQYGREDVDFLAALARQASIGLSNARLLDEHRRMVQLENELNVARQIQTGLFPPDFESTPQLQIRAFNEPGRQVSGDYYDIVPRRDGRVALVVADASGKGVAAALLAANLQAAVRVVLPDAHDLAEITARWNNLLYENTDDSKFVTMLLVVVDAEKRTVEFVSAGHPCPCRVGPGGILGDLPAVHGLPLGVTRDETYRCSRVELGADPVSFLMFTDGVPEAMNEQEELFGNERLRQTLGGGRRLDPESLIAGVRTAVKRFTGHAQQADDITMIGVHLPKS